MILRIHNTEFRHFNNVDVQLTFGCVASCFSVDMYYDPTVAAHRDALKPCAYAPFALYDDAGVLLITGVLLRMLYVSSAVPGWVRVSGYSKTGVLEDCEIPLSSYPLQTNNLTLLQVCERLCKPFGIDVVVAPSVARIVNQKIVKTTASESQSVKSYLSQLCSGKQVVLSHTPNGELLLTNANATQAPVYSFGDGKHKGFSFSLDVNGQGMHSHVGVVRQAYKRDDGGTLGQSVLRNPYVPVFRSAVKRQSAGRGDADTQATARNVLSSELRNIELTIEIADLRLHDVVVRPGMMVSVHNTELYLFSPTLFFVEKVEYKDGVNDTYSRLVCYLPEVYNSVDPKNIFG